MKDAQQFEFLLMTGRLH